MLGATRKLQWIFVAHTFSPHRFPPLRAISKMEKFHVQNVWFLLHTKEGPGVVVQWEDGVAQVVPFGVVSLHTWADNVFRTVDLDTQVDAHGNPMRLYISDDDGTQVDVLDLEVRRIARENYISAPR